MGKLYSQQEKDFIIENYKEMGADKCAEVLSRPRNSVQAMAQKLGIRQFYSRKWNSEDLKFLEESYPSNGGYYCAEHLGRSFHAVHKMVEKLGLEIENKGYYIDQQGYKVLVFSRDNKVYEHRYVMEKVLGRPLLPTEIVHHKDGNKQNNDPENLFLTDRAEHINEHREELVKAQRESLKIKS